MTADELQDRYVRRLANGGYVRYWLYLNYPVETPWLMAIRAIDDRGKFRPIPDLINSGFRLEDHDGTALYVIDRTDRARVDVPNHRA